MASSWRGYPGRIPLSASARARKRAWTATTYPSAKELADLRAEAVRAADARKELEKVEARCNNSGAPLAHPRWQALHQTMQRLRGELPADCAALRKRHAGLQAEEQALEKTLAANRQTLKDTDREEERLRKERDKSNESVVKLTGQLKEQDVIRQLAEQGIAKVQKQLLPTWHAAAQTAGMRDLTGWIDERTDLERARTDERGKQLHQARAGLDNLREEVLALEMQQDTYAADARQDPAAIQTALTAAKQTELACDKALTEAEKNRALLENIRKQRQGIEQDYLHTEAELTTEKLLAELLGRDRLQLYLVRQAEKQVVEYANAVLDRLSGGQLYLKLSGEAEWRGAAPARPSNWRRTTAAAPAKSRSTCCL